MAELTVQQQKCGCAKTSSEVVKSLMHLTAFRDRMREAEAAGRVAKETAVAETLKKYEDEVYGHWEREARKNLSAIQTECGIKPLASIIEHMDERHYEEALYDFFAQLTGCAGMEGYGHYAEEKKSQPSGQDFKLFHRLEE